MTSCTEREIRDTVQLSGPPERAFAAWVEPVALGGWWGPATMQLSTAEFAFEAGGSWWYRLEHPDFGSIDHHLRYVEIVVPSRIVYESLLAGQQLYEVHVQFEPNEGGARLSLCMRFPSVEAYERAVGRHHADVGVRQMLQRLHDLLE